VKAGRASHIEDLGNGRILRRGGNPVREAVVMEHARRHGYPAPEVHEVRGDALVLEKVDGPTIQEDIQVRPWMLARHMRTLAGLHHRLHEIDHPEGGTLLHLDLHSLNVIVGPDGPVVIDWTNAAAGDAALDPALVWVIFRTSGVPVASRLAARLFISHFDREEIAAALEAACLYRLADPNTLPRERVRVERLRRRYA
jgi:tRNA A-37 threonylcarbamoyl transferase component Bud32